MWAIVVAAGDGSRFGGAKQFARLAGRSLVERAVATAREACDGVVVVLPPDGQWVPPEGVATVTGGVTRSESVRAGLRAVPPDAETIVVHDAARPLATRALFLAAVRAVEAGADAAIPAIPVADTVKRVSGGRVVETVARDGLHAVQTPQAFRAEVLRDAHAGGATGTDDAALVEAAGWTVVVVEGEARNIKVTVATDLELIDGLMGAE